MKKFKVGSSGSIDEITETDGIAVLNANLGPKFPKGLLVAHDESNQGGPNKEGGGGTSSNLKLIDLQDIVLP